MPTRTKKLLATVAGGAVAASLAAAPAGAETLNIRGGTIFRPGKAIIDNMRFVPLKRGIKSGNTLTIRNRTNQPHTLSIVKKSELPRTLAKFESFFESPVMGEFMQAHEVDPANEEAPPGKLLVDVGESGFDQRGDSVFFQGKQQKIDVTAKGGTDLSYICLLHPWMQGTLKVKR